MRHSGSDWSYAAASGGVTDTADVPLKAAVSGFRNFLASVQVRNAHATVATEVVIKDGSTIIWRDRLPAAMPGAQTITFEAPLVSSRGAALNFACLTTGAQVYVNAQGYEAA